MKLRWMSLSFVFFGCDVARLEPAEPEPEPGVCEVERPAFAAQFGTARADWATALLGTEDRLWIGGYEDGALGGTVDPEQNSRGFVTAIDVAGDALGRWSIDSPSTDVVEALVDVGEARPVALGRTRGALRGPSAGQFDGFVARLGAGGAVETVLQFGGDGPERPRSMTRFGDGWVIGGTDDLFVATNYVERWSNPMFAFVDADLGAADLHRFDSEVEDVGAGAAAIDDAVFLAWHVTAGPQKGVHAGRFDASGALVWDARLTPIGIDAAAQVMIVDGKVVVAGSVYGGIGDNLQIGEQDGFVAWLDPEDGALLDSVQFGGLDADFVRAMTIGPDGVIHVVAETYGEVVPGSYQGEQDVFVVSIADGEVVRAWQGGSAHFDEASAIAVGPCGRVFIAGATDGEVVEGQQRGGATDAFVLEVR